MATVRQPTERGAAPFAVAGFEHAQAEAETVAEFLSRTGYDLPVAIADLVDNSIDAGAGRVQVAIVMRKHRPAMLAVADDGHGMSLAQLKAAVSLAKDPRKQDGRALGRYGAGLKAASFSLGRRLYVSSRSNGSAAVGAVLDHEEYKRDYRYQALERASAEAILATNWGGGPLGPTGTVVLIEDLVTMVPSSDTSQDLFLRMFAKELDVRLGLVFHRFLESGRLVIGKSRRSLSGSVFGAEFDNYSVSPINPFGYEVSGLKSYPKRLKVATAHSTVPVALHLWPKQGRTKATRHQFYEILGRSGEWQGLYFYRWDRLLQTGGWNGLRSQEPHMSYARIEVDLPEGSDDEFRPTVTKDRIENARPLLEALMARPEWRPYMDAASRVYRGTKGATSRPLATKRRADSRRRTKFVALRRGPSIRFVDGEVRLDGRLVTRLGKGNADAIAEVAWLASRGLVRRKRLTPELRTDLSRLESAIARLAGRRST